MRIDDARRARAAVLESIGAPPVLREFDIPRPGPGQLIVACSYGGICGTDLHLQQGHLPIPVPIVLGHEGLGVIRELGPGVVADALGAPLQPGDRVMWASSIACGVCVSCRQYREPTLCEARQTYGVNRSIADEPLSGAWADHILLQPGTTVVRLADSVTDLAAMSLACAGPTLIHALYERRPVRLGETVIVQGSGPVGLAAAAFAQLAGAAQVIVVGGPAHRLDIAKSCGIGDAHLDIIGAADQSAVLDQVGQLTGGRGADLVIECTGVPAAVQQGITLARRGGALLIIGQYTDAGPTSINPHHIVRQQLDVLGSWAFTGAHLVEYVRLLPTLTNRFDLASLVSVFPLAQCVDAMAAVAAGSVMKAVLAGAGISETD
ncbi:zinc-binding dehydrogenase [Nocardia sp. NPDC049149]|uniref:zinc-binding dehydrogenase n=1 Tax=Nocardia sp. NPDC049149 TaxID=3364315 RepID=UPI0037172AD3